MKKIFCLLVLILGIWLTGCKEENADIKTVEMTNILDEYYIDDFDISTISIDITYDNDQKESIPLSTSMLSETDLNKLTRIGEHEVTVIYNEIKINLAINLTDSYEVVFKTFDEVVKVERVKYGESAAAPVVEELAGYNFKGFDKDYSNITKDLEVNIVYEKKEYKVTFLDNEGKVIEEEIVKHGESATAPVVEELEGYNFKGFDRDYSNVVNDLEVNAVYEKKEYVVKYLFGEEVIYEEIVKHGESATAPVVEELEGYNFKGFDRDYSNITKDLDIYLVYEKKEYIVTFLDIDGNVAKNDIVKYNEEAIAPTLKDIGYYRFDGWNKEYTNITKDIVIKPIYTKNTLELDEEIKKQFIKECGESAEFKYSNNIDSIELLCIIDDLYVFCFEYVEYQIKINGYFYYEVKKDDETAFYFEYYKDYRRNLIIWSPKKGVISDDYLYPYTDPYGAYQYENLLTLEQVESIPWPKVYELPDDPNNVGKIDEETINQFRIDLNKSYIRNEDITYFGTYNDVIVMGVNIPMSFDLLIEEKIEDRILRYYEGRNRLYAYKDGIVYTIQDAYNSGILTYEDICKIPYTYRLVAPKEIESYKVKIIVKEGTSNNYYPVNYKEYKIGELDISNLSVTLSFAGSIQSRVYIEEGMITVESLNKLNTAGTHEITCVCYSDYIDEYVVIKFTVTIIE